MVPYVAGLVIQIARFLKKSAAFVSVMRDYREPTFEKLLFNLVVPIIRRDRRRQRIEDSNLFLKLLLGCDQGFDRRYLYSEILRYKLKILSYDLGAFLMLLSFQPLQPFQL